MKIIVINLQFKGWRENNTKQYYTRDNPSAIENTGQKRAQNDSTNVKMFNKRRI